MKEQEPESIINEDYRLQAITTVAEDFSLPGGPEHLKGAVVLLVANTKFNGKNLNFGLPNVSALFLDFSNKLWTETEEYLNNEKNFLTPISKFAPPNSLSVHKKEELFDILEKRMGAIVFAYTALESFANHSIPEDFIFRQDRADRKYVEEYNREQIENYISLDIKLDKILPQIFNVKSPKGKYLWNQYIDLKVIRNRIIHLKQEDTRSTGPEVKTLWTDLMNMKAPNYAEEVKKIINFYYPEEDKKPRWLVKAPF